jgi:hypothetical protein
VIKSEKKSDIIVFSEIQTQFNGDPIIYYDPNQKPYRNDFLKDFKKSLKRTIDQNMYFVHNCI